MADILGKLLRAGIRVAAEIDREITKQEQLQAQVIDLREGEGYRVLPDDSQQLGGQ